MLCGMRIFLSYAREDALIAEEVFQALTIENHKVFFDPTAVDRSNPPNERIREEVKQADLFIAIVSSHVEGDGRYVHSELKLAKDKWPTRPETVRPSRWRRSLI